MTLRVRRVAVAALVLSGISAWTSAQDAAAVPPKNGQPSATGPATRPGGKPRIQISQREFDFGQVWQGESLRADVAITNVGDAPLEIERIEKSCGCMVPSKPKSPLAPGESDKLSIEVDSRKKSHQFRMTATVYTNDPAEPSVLIHVAGDVQPLLEFKPTDSFLFGQLVENSVEQRTIEVNDRYTEKLALKLKEGQDLSLAIKELEPGRRFEVTAATRPPLSVGRFNKQLVLETGLPLLPEINMLVYWFVQPPVEVRPQKLQIPKTSVSELTLRLTVTYLADAPIEITAVKSSDDSIKARVEAPTPDRVQRSLLRYVIQVTLPPADRLPTDPQPTIEITTTSPDPRFQRLVVPIVVFEPQPTGDGPPGPNRPGQLPSRVPLRPAAESEPESRPAESGVGEPSEH